MKYALIVLLAVAAIAASWFAITVLPATTHGDTPVRIMPLGDSITQGSKLGLGYRLPLWRKLRDHGCDVDFIGSQRWPRMPDDIDPDHQGHKGWRSDEINESLNGWLKNARPDVVLLHLGTNDVLQQITSAETIRNLSGVIDKLRRVNPNVTILLAQLVPASIRDPEIIKKLNAAIATLAVQSNTSQSPIILVDHHSGYDLSMHYDWLHPGPSGAELMAERWLQALLPVLGSACAK